jgi:hypothetical protein
VTVLADLAIDYFVDLEVGLIVVLDEVVLLTGSALVGVVHFPVHGSTLSLERLGGVTVSNLG